MMQALRKSRLATFVGPSDDVGHDGWVFGSLDGGRAAA
jgi:hypothetical protein